MNGAQQPAAAADRHVPVLLERCVALLTPALARPRSVVIDATLGMGGHSAAMLERFPELTLIGIDRDPAALALAGTRLSAHADRIHLVHAVYDEIPGVLERLGFAEVDGVLFDLGVSSLQLDEAGRGFSYQQAAALDMRMNPHDRLTAADVVNTYSQVELTRLISQYGEERFAGRIAAAIIGRRAQRPIALTTDLAELVREAIPAAARRTGGHPAKRTFQAIRIEVNQELGVLRRALPAALAAVNVGGRVVAMSYHSLEDRIVKQAFAAVVKDEYPIDLPLPAGHSPEFRLVTKGAEQPDAAECGVNPRASSARLRAVERLRAAA